MSVLFDSVRMLTYMTTLLGMKINQLRHYLCSRSMIRSTRSSRNVVDVVGVHGGLDVRGVPSELLRDGRNPLLLALGVADGGGEGVDEGDLGGHAPVRHHAGVFLHQELHHVPPNAAVHLRLDVVT